MERKFEIAARKHALSSAVVDSLTSPTLVGPFFRKVGVSISAFDCFGKGSHRKRGYFAGFWLTARLWLLVIVAVANCENPDNDFLENLPELPHQPLTFCFPKRTFGIKTVVERCFQASWFQRWTWLHYNEAKDSVHCHLCLKAVKLKHIAFKIGDDAAFVSSDNPQV